MEKERINKYWSVSLDEGVDNKEMVKSFFKDCGLTPFNCGTLDNSIWGQDSTDIKNSKFSWFGAEVSGPKRFTIPSQWEEAKKYICATEEDVVEYEENGIYTYINGEFVLISPNFSDEFNKVQEDIHKKLFSEPTVGFDLRETIYSNNILSEPMIETLDELICKIEELYETKYGMVHRRQAEFEIRGKIDYENPLELTKLFNEIKESKEFL